MHQLTKLAFVLSCALSVTPVLAEEQHAHWGYEGDVAPANWGKLSDEYAVCGNGKNQSPVDIHSAVKARLAPLATAYQAGGDQILNNGHTIQVIYEAGSHISIDGAAFTLKQFHFHAPSENLIAGRSYPLEVHLVHADEAGNLAVVALMFNEGKANPLLQTLWAQMPAKAGDKVALNKSVNVADLLPKDKHYYRFAGSLTTPPCSEGVRWLVLKKPMTASKQQIEQFAKLMGHPNNRPVQTLGARQIVE
ncbi:MAG: carbonic anhydrase [Aeromonadaceae bacterium]